MDVMIVLFYLSIVKIYSCANSNTLDVIRLPVQKFVNDDQQLLLTTFKGIKYNQLEQMIADGKVDDQFRRVYMLYVLSCFLCPTLEMAPNSKFLGAIVDVQNSHKYNWSEFICSDLVRHIKAYKSKKGKAGSIGGCLFCLMVC